MSKLNGKTALVTGVGRSAGIGAAICREIAKNGGDIFFTYLRQYDKETHLDDTRDYPSDFINELKNLGVRVASAEIDLSEIDSAEKLCAMAYKEFGSLDILINNACHDFEIPFVELSPEILDIHYAVNVRAVTMLCKEFVKRGKAGDIINMTSGQSIGSMGENKIPYTITKAAMEMLTPQLAPELLKYGITINSIDPGPTDTGWMTEDLKEKIRKESKKGIINGPQDIALLIIELLTNENKTTGEIIHAER